MKFSSIASTVFFLVLCLAGFSGSARSQWVQTTGPNNVFSFAVNGSSFFAGSDEGIYRSLDSGKSWSLMGLDTSLISSIVIQKNNIFAATQNAGIFVSTDNGSHWTQDTTGLNGVKIVSALVLSDTTLIAGTPKGLFISSDYGAIWQRTSIDSTTNPLSALGTDVYGIVGTNSVYFSSDEGQTWTKTGTWPSFTYALVQIGNTLYAALGAGQGAAVSTNQGATWTNISNGMALFPSLNCHCIVAYGNNLFVGTNIDVYSSSDFGTDWVSDSAVDSMQNPIYTNTLFVWDGKLWSGTEVNGPTADSICYRPLSKIPLNAVAAAPLSVTVLTVYPNPAFAQSTVGIQLSRAGMASISMVNILGETVSTLYRGELADGNHSFSWNASGLAPGMYECVAIVDGQTMTTPIVVSR